ncbi:MAG TPA: hypothetical protein VEP90_04985 [Methylomirabilota bacterium]|nr:hypothetical protein [Methylomirabilota bacterium]
MSNDAKELSETSHERSPFFAVAFLGVDLIFIQGFISQINLDVLEIISMSLLSLSVPLLSLWIIVGRRRKKEFKDTFSWGYDSCVIVGELSSVAGLVIAFWHLHWIVGVSFLIAGIYALIIFIIEYASNKLKPIGKG